MRSNAASHEDSGRANAAQYTPEHHRLVELYSQQKSVLWDYVLCTETSRNPQSSFSAAPPFGRRIFLDVNLCSCISDARAMS